MSITLVENSSSRNEISLLSNIEFKNNSEGRFFKLSDSEGNEINVKYVPDFVSNWDASKYDIYLFENPYLTAENDIFEVYENSIGGRLGWICPISALDSNDNDYVNNDSFKHYRYVAYYKLLQSDIKLTYQELKLEYRLSEMFTNISVCILSKKEIVEIPDFKIENYLLSFIKFDYLIFNGVLKGKVAFNKTARIEFLRKGNHKIKIKKSSFDILSNQYTKSLFFEHLYQSENFLVKYILLYQILEYFIQEIADEKLDELIESYKNNTISKNTFKERIAKFSNDRTLVKKVFEKGSINRDLKRDFIEKCVFLFKDVGEDIDEGFEDALYDLRNLITHRYRAISTKTDELMEIIILFELIIIELLVNFDEKVENEKVDTVVKKIN